MKRSKFSEEQSPLCPPLSPKLTSRLGTCVGNWGVSDTNLL
jgi:hypothetical protein